MSERDDFQERTEAATPRHLEKLKENGHILRSKEWTTLLVVLSAVSSLVAFEERIIVYFESMIKQSFTLDRKIFFSNETMLIALMAGLKSGILIVLPIFACVILAVVLGNVAIGGVGFHSNLLAPKFNRINPFSGLKRIFSVHSLLELLKACLKVTAILFVAYLIISYQWPSLFMLATMPLSTAMSTSIGLLHTAVILFAVTLILVSAIDIPYQLYKYIKDARMTKQEIKDEFKDTEGKPEVKGRLRQLQREIAKRRMMTRIADADVVIANPEHFAVAISYDKTTMRAPIVVAKGVELIALKIKEKAKENHIPVLEAPPLARALYYSTELEEPIPTELYVAVAQVLAYVYQLRRFEKGQVSEKPLLKELPIPDHLKR